MTIMLLIRAQSQTHLSTIPIWIERNAYSVREIGRMMTNLTAKVREAREGKEVKGAGRVTGIWAGKETGQEQGEKQETWASREGSGGETGERVRVKERGRRKEEDERENRERVRERDWGKGQGHGERQETGTGRETGERNDLLCPVFSHYDLNDETRYDYGWFSQCFCTVFRWGAEDWSAQLPSVKGMGVQLLYLPYLAL